MEHWVVFGGRDVFGGVRREPIVFLEKGKYNPSLRLAHDVAKALGAKMEEVSLFED